MIFTLNEIETFRRCPLRYKFQYIDKIPIERDSMNEMLSRSVHKVIYYIFNSIMSGTRISSTLVRQKWEQEWFNGVSVQDILFGEKKDITEAGYKGLGMINTLFRDVADNPGFIIGVNIEADKVPIGDYFITTDIELIREVEEGNSKLIEIVDFRTGNVTIDPWMARNDLRLTIQSYAFRRMFQAKEQRCSYYFLRNGKKVDTRREENQFNRLYKLIDFMANSIKKDLFYANEGYQCNNCPFRDICNEWPLEDLT